MAENTPAKVEAENEDDDLYTTIGSRRSFNPLGAARGQPEDDPDNPYHKIEFIHDVPLKLSVEIGQAQLSVRDVLGLHIGKVIEFNKVVGEPMDISVSGRLMARGEIVVVNERYGVRISEVTRPDESGEITTAEK